MSMGLANVVTMFRIVLVVVFIAVMFADPRDASVTGSWLAFMVFAVAAASDSLDGYIARNHGRITSLGQSLDPFADKLLIGAAVVTLAMFRDFPLWAVVVILGREAAVSLLRFFVVRGGRPMPASRTGKLKTALQVPMVLLWMFPRVGTMVVVQDISVWIAVVLTVVSGLRYFVKVGSASEQGVES
jgi:CDP-diacylglycerol--glycerol-3-phosphate 3-phosphatidyltransferase